jgi:uncharacterized protein YbbK (DUF523 family)
MFLWIGFGSYFIQLSEKTERYSGNRYSTKFFTKISGPKPFLWRRRKRMIRVLVSACLMGQPVRYDGAAMVFNNHILNQWQQEERIVPFCPEVAAGLTVPRPPAEISGGDGGGILSGYGRVLNVLGENVSDYFIDGAQKALELAHIRGIKLAVLKDGSPSCGSTYIYDGSFSGKQKTGKGLTAALLEKEGIRVFSERVIQDAAGYLNTIKYSG